MERARHPAARFDVLGIGNAMVDVVSHVEDAFVDQHGLAKGAMTLVDEERAEALYTVMENCVMCSGGSAANTVAGLAAIGARAAYIGKVRDDDLGQVFSKDIRAAGVAFDMPPAPAGPSTGRCMVFVTPDAQRTMQTYLGASATLAPDDLDQDAIGAADIVYLEGYLYDPPPAKAAFLRAAELAHRAGRRVALSLSDSFCVDRHRADFLRLVAGHVDILFANEEEIMSLYEVSGLDKALRQVGTQCELAAVTLGARGSVIVQGDRIEEVAADATRGVVDTTGAGDLYASGFLFGLVRGEDLPRCAWMGSTAAGEIISHFGARPECSLHELVGGSCVVPPGPETN